MLHPGQLVLFQFWPVLYFSGGMVTCNETRNINSDDDGKNRPRKKRKAMLKRYSIPAATVAGALLVILDMGTKGGTGFLVGGCILLGSAIIAAHLRQ
jgi:hypothetical protein